MGMKHSQKNFWRFLIRFIAKVSRIKKIITKKTNGERNIFMHFSIEFDNFLHAENGETINDISPSTAVLKMKKFN